MATNDPVVLRIPVPSVPAPRPRVRHDGHTYYPADYSEWQSDTATVMRAAWHRAGQTAPISTPVGVTIFHQAQSMIIWLDPDGPPRVKGLAGDLDNHVKAVLDAMVKAGILVSDLRVTRLDCRFEAG